jgi:hypothetical protein
MGDVADDQKVGRINDQRKNVKGNLRLIRLPFGRFAAPLFRTTRYLLT